MNLIKYFLIRDIKSRYAGSSLGIAWSFLIPIAQICLFWFVFSVIMKARPYRDTDVPYIYFLLSSFFFWLAFSEGLLRASYAITGNAEMVKKVAFPNIVLPVTATLSTYIHHSVGFLLFLIFFFATTSFNTMIIFIVPIVLLQVFFSLGLGMFVSALLPYMRDLEQLLGPVMQGLFFLSPIIYSLDAIPEKVRVLFYFNPMTYFASSYQTIILAAELPRAFDFLIMVLISSAVFLGGFYTFKKLKEGFADVL